jgi:hypothetical protein
VYLEGKGNQSLQLRVTAPHEFKDHVANEENVMESAPVTQIELREDSYVFRV